MLEEPLVVAVVTAVAAVAVFSCLSCRCCSCGCCNMLVNACMSVSITAASDGVDGSLCCDLRGAARLGMVTVPNTQSTH